MKTRITTIVIAAFLGYTANALVVTNGVTANTTAPDELTGWDFIADKGVPIGARVICTSKMIAAKEVVYLGVTNKIVKTVDAPAGSFVRFLITEHELPAWSPVATSVPSGDFPIYLVASGVGCKSTNGTDCDTDGNTWKWGNNSTRAKRWGTGTAKQYGNNLFWKLGNCQAADGDRTAGNGMFTMDNQYIGPIFAGPNPTTKTQASAGAIAFLWLHLVDEYMRPTP